MPTYDYKCARCAEDFSVIQSITKYNGSADCTKCGFENHSNSRDFSKSRVQFSGTSVVDAQFNPGLGCVVKNKRQKEDICKAKGLVEVGNDFNSGKNMQEHFEKRKQKELDSKWDKDPSDFFL